jgi:galactoside O-acetyltransferase
MQRPDDDRYFTEQELRDMKFRSLGTDVLIARTCRLYVPEYISIGDRTVIDDFCVISGNIDFGANVHIAHGCRVIAGREGVKMADFSGLAFDVTIFAQSDDYSGASLTNPTVPMKYRNISRGRVEIGRHAIIGAGTIIFPGVNVGEGASVGAASMVTKALEPWTVNFGAPTKRLRQREKTMLALEKQYLEELGLAAPPPSPSVDSAQAK